MRTEVLVIGSGAGGATTAATLAEAGREVVILEEGPAVDPRIGTHTPEAMRQLYRNAGLSPIFGRVPIAFVEGRCVGGSTEINSSFWHRPPAAAVERWRREYRVAGLSDEEVVGLFEELESNLHPALSNGDALPPSSRVFRQGLERVGTKPAETPRLQSGDPTSSQFAPGAKRSMSHTYLPRAARAGAKLLAESRVKRLHFRGRRASGATVVQRDGGVEREIRIEAETVFVCGGAIQTPALLRRSGVKKHVGDTLRIQPMVKAAAEFDEVLDAHRSVMPVYQLRDVESGVFLGGSVFTPGFLGLALSERWPENEPALRDWRRMGLYYAACRGSGAGTVRVFPGTGESIVRYGVTAEDRRNLQGGLSRLCEVLFAGGATRIFPGVRGRRPLESAREAATLLDRRLPPGDLSLSTVHVSSSCPMGEDDGCPVDSFGRLRGFDNVRVSDASVIPDAPGVNPQGTVMALALRNVRHFLSEGEREGESAA